MKRARMVCGAAAGVVLGALAAGPASADLVSAMVDVSSYNQIGPVIDGARAAGVELVMHRATLGASRTDKSFEADYAAIRAAKLGLGAYHLLYPPVTPGDAASDGTAQARAYLSALAAVCKKNDAVLLAVDWETYVHPNLPPDPPPPPLPPATTPSAPAPSATLAEFQKEVARLTGITPVVYTDSSTLSMRQASDIDPAIAASPLWYARIHHFLRFDADPTTLSIKGDDAALTLTIARKRVDSLVAPTADDIAPWGRPTFWQFSAGTAYDPKTNPLAWPQIRMIEPNVQDLDTDWFLGSRVDFRAFVKAHSWKCDPKIQAKWTGPG